MQINLPALITFVDKIQPVLVLPDPCERNARGFRRNRDNAEASTAPEFTMLLFTLNPVVRVKERLYYRY
jgi:hypothetical protein